MSYDGQINFGLVGDYDAMPDLDELAADLAAAIDELAAVAGVEPAARRRRRRSRRGRPRRLACRARGPTAARAGAQRQPS